eukprot:CAMPEP_0170555934 /NCGR_PEP_ID=MMETSP0211-20121228/14749_1 /TAXON_ID=311385 /ORGANISM="Pseudokeronopsis sp., Strain OXSARD2" /LENGTH=67 /DNA_ID=CAMNT_0010865971 /DNA_START=540 /DNA_END=743 /DNA_ORIENTATION=-
MAGLGLLDVDELVDGLVDLEEVGVGLLADLALEVLPVHTGELIGLLLDHLAREPVLQALVVDEAHAP